MGHIHLAQMTREKVRSLRVVAFQVLSPWPYTVLLQVLQEGAPSWLHPNILPFLLFSTSCSQKYCPKILMPICIKHLLSLLVEQGTHHILGAHSHGEKLWVFLQCPSPDI